MPGGCQETLPCVALWPKMPRKRANLYPLSPSDYIHRDPGQYATVHGTTSNSPRVANAVKTKKRVQKTQKKHPAQMTPRVEHTVS